MRAVILCGGTGSRLAPLTTVVNKHLLPVGKKPMIFHSIEKCVEAGLKDILIVTGVEHMGGIMNLLGSGSAFGCDFTYKVQDKAGGIAQALSLAENFANKENVCVILGDNIFEDSLVNLIKEFKEGARVFLKEVSDPQRFGVATLKDGRVVEIQEKPKKPKTNLAVTGIYLYDSKVFDVIKTLGVSARGEMEVTDLNSNYINKNQMEYAMLKGWWSDAGTFESLHKVNKILNES